jgi:hypothetical protein
MLTSVRYSIICFMTYALTQGLSRFPIAIHTHTHTKRERERERERERDHGNNDI